MANLCPNLSIQSQIFESLDSQKSWLPEVLVIGPGGLKGFAELGALQKLDESKHLELVNTVIGVSIGSIIGLLYVCGYNFKEITEIGMKVDLFKNHELDLFEIFQNKGIISHNIIKDPLEDTLIKKYGFIPTLSDIFRLFGKNFISVSYNLNTKEAVYFNRISFPNMSVIDAALASCSIPFVFHQFAYEGEIYVDGALANPYPINIIEDVDVLGIYVHDDSVTDINKVANYLSTLMYAPINELRKEIIRNCNIRCHHLKLCIDIEDVTGLTIDNSKRQVMYDMGYQAAIKYLES